jgi:hypothetical protein
MTVSAIVMSRFEDKIVPEPNSGCWLWTGGADKLGYGCVYLGGGRANTQQDRIHRVMYRAAFGEIPAGYWIDHLCRTPACCNPDHLEAVEPRLNVIRGLSPMLAAKRQTDKTHCPQGHPYAGDNLVLTAKGERLCRTCRRKNDRLVKQRKRIADQRPEAHED